MRRTKDLLVEIIGQEACRRTGELAGKLVRAKPADKEEILAEMDFQGWLAESCQDCLDLPRTLR